MTDRTHDTLIDDLVHAHVDWREASAAVEYAYRRWSVALSSDAADAFAVYVAALDREELASGEYARLHAQGMAAQALAPRRPQRLSDAA
jgi:hypothetical protein